MRTMEPNLKTNFFFRLSLLSYPPSISFFASCIFPCCFHSFCCLLLCPPFFSVELHQHHRKAISLAIRLPFHRLCRRVDCVSARAHAYTHHKYIHKNCLGDIASAAVAVAGCFVLLCCSLWTTIFVSHSFVQHISFVISTVCVCLNIP